MKIRFIKGRGKGIQYMTLRKLFRDLFALRRYIVSGGKTRLRLRMLNKRWAEHFVKTKKDLLLKLEVDLPDIPPQTRLLMIVDLEAFELFEGTPFEKWIEDFFVNLDTQIIDDFIE